MAHGSIGDMVGRRVGWEGDRAGGGARAASVAPVGLSAPFRAGFMFWPLGQQ